MSATGKTDMYEPFDPHALPCFTCGEEAVGRMMLGKVSGWCEAVIGCNVCGLEVRASSRNPGQAECDARDKWIDAQYQRSETA